MSLLELEVATHEALSVRHFVVREGISETFEVTVVARSLEASLDLDGIVGHPATFRLVTDVVGTEHPERRWKGVCRRAEVVQTEPDGLSTYRFEIVPTLWLLSQRRDHRIEQHRSAVDIAAKLLDHWRIEHRGELDADAHPPLPYKVQYAESDLAFFRRLLEEGGVAFTLLDGSEVLLSDRLDAGPPRSPALTYFPKPNDAKDREFVTDVRLADETRIGSVVLRDYDHRKPSFRLVGEARGAAAAESGLEHYEYVPGGFLRDIDPPGDTPTADDTGAGRHDASQGERRARRTLEAERADKKVVSFHTNALDVWPGRVFTMSGHPHPDLAATRRLLVTELRIEGTPAEAWAASGRAVFADQPYRPRRETPRSRARVQSATVVGGEEIHPDEYGRVRVRFPWDRTGESTCWVRVGQQWGGAGHGVIALPRAGQEVLVDFLEGDPEQPVIVGRLPNRINAASERLPARQTRTGWKSDISGGFNQILYEDQKGSELVYAQAERDARRLVKHDDTSTIGHDRRKLVGGDELETTDAERVQETRGSRVELTYGDATVAIDGVRKDRVDERAVERIEGDQLLCIAKDDHGDTAAVLREHVEHDMHLSIQGGRPEAVGGKDSLTVGKALNESVGDYSVVADGPEGWIHHIANTKIFIESGATVTFKAGGDFVSVGGPGVIIQGSEVAINEGGSPGDGPGVAAELPEEAVIAEVIVPDPPPPFGALAPDP